MLVPFLILFSVLALQANDLETGQKAMDEGRFADAEAAFSRAVAAQPDDYYALFNLSLSQTFVEKDDQAIAGFYKVLEMKPGLAEAQINLGLLLHRHRKFTEAAEQLKAALEQKPNDARVTFHLADSLRETKKCSEAEPYYRRVMELDSADVASKLSLARCLVELDRMDEADPLFRESDGALELAQLYEDKGQPEKAVPIYEAAVREKPDVQVLTHLIAIYLQQKQPLKAQEFLESALKQSPDDYDFLITYGRLLRDQKNFVAAANHFIHALKVKQDDIPALNELAGMLISLNEDAKAMSVLDRLRELNAETPGQTFFRAVILDRNKQVRAALQAYQAFLSSSGGKFPDEEFKARQRARVLEKEAAKGRK